MHKKVVHTAARHALNAMVLPCNISSVFFVNSVIEHLSGKSQATALIADSIGLNYGSPKAIVFGSYARSPDTAIPRLNASRIIGYTNHPKNNLNTVTSNTLFMMPPISIKTGVSLIS